MTKNMGNTDRAVRLVFGLGLISLAFIGPKTPWGFIGIIPLVTSAIGFCPLYRLLGFSTKSHEMIKK